MKKIYLFLLALACSIGMMAEEATLSEMVTSGTIVEDVITFETAANGAANPALSSDGSQLRLYANSSSNMSTGVKGGSITFTAASGYVINQVTLAIANDGNSNTTAGYQIDGEGSWVGTADNVVKNTNYSTADNLGATTVEIANFGTVTKSNRIYITSITVKYASTLNDCTSSVTITKGTETNGTFTLSQTGDVCIDEGNASVDVTATPNEHYYLQSVTTESGTAGEIANNQCTVSGISANTTITCVFAAVPTHNAQFSVNGVIDNHNDKVVYEGEAITFPADPADIYGKKFQGWTKTQDYSNVTTAPSDLCKADDMGNVDVTYYAVFADVEREEEWQKITATNQVVAGTYALISFDGDYYLSNAAATGNAPAVTAVTKTDGTIDILDAMKWTLTISNDKYTFESAAVSGSYLWGANTNEGIRVVATSTKNAAFKEWVLAENATYGLILKDAGSTGRYLSTYGTQDWRNYTSVSNSNRAANLYKLVDASFINYTTTIASGSFTLTDIDGAGWGTYYTDFAFVMPENVEGRLMKNVEGTIKAVTTYAAGTVVPANTGLLLKGTAGNYDIVETLTAASISAEGNLLKGSVEGGTTTGGNVYYKLANDSEDGLGWYWGAADGAAFTCGAHKAYLALDAAPSLAPAVIHITDETDIVTSVENLNQETTAVKFFENGQIYILKNGNVYNVAGQVVR